MNLKFKYLVVEYITETVDNPYWTPLISNIESRKICTVKTRIQKIFDDEALTRFCLNRNSGNKFEIFEISKELVPVIETKTTVKFV